MTGKAINSKWVRIAALLCLCVPMFASFFFDDMFSTLSQIFTRPETLQLGWDSADYGFYAGGYSFLCVCGGLIVCGVLLDVFGVRLVGSIFVGLMAVGALTVFYALLSALPAKSSLAIAYVGCTIFGLGSEIAGVAVKNAIAKWFKGGNIAFAMGLQIALARLGTAAAFVISPILVAQKAPGEIYSLWDTARPALVGLSLLLAGCVTWAVYVALDAAKDRADNVVSLRGTVSEKDKFKMGDLLKLFTNARFILIALLCVFFYCCIISFKKFGTAIVIPRFGMDIDDAKWMISMIPFSTVVFAPLFGILVDKSGHAGVWMLGGAITVLLAHLMLCFAPSGMSVFGYVSIALLGVANSVVPAAMWPTVPHVVPEKNLGTAYSLIYWIQNIGLLLVPVFVGKIFSAHGESIAAARGAEYIFIGLGTVAVGVATALLFLLLSRASSEGRTERPE